MEINEKILHELLNKKESCWKTTILNWNISENIIKPGENSTSELSRLRVEYKKKNKVYTKHFILKIPSIYPTYEIMKEYSMFDKECLMYARVLNEMYRLDGENIGPKLYYIGDKHSLILKDLHRSGYQTVSRVQQLDFTQCSLVLKSLAKFHALSVKIDQSCGIDPIIKTIKWKKILEPDDVMRPLFEFCYDRSVENLTLNVKLKYREKLLKIKKKFIKDVVLEARQIFKFNVLNHGDLWTSNVLFKFNKYGVAEKVRFVDFQNSFWISPSNDILKFTISSMQFEVFEEHFDSLLKIYIDTLNPILSFFGCEIYKLEDLKIDMERFPAHIFLMIFAVLPIYLSDTKDPQHFKDCFVNGKIDLDKVERYFQSDVNIERMRQWFSYYVDKGLLDLFD